MTTSATIYQFLSLCLLYPEPDLVSQLHETAAATNLQWAGNLVATFAAETMETLQVEHTRLFVNNIDGVPCPPYESAYVDGQLLTATTRSVAAAFAEWGLEQSLETADFLPVELQFVAYLHELAEQSSEPETVELARRHFETAHLQRWLPRFATDLQQHARVDFYREVGNRLAELINTPPED